MTEEKTPEEIIFHNVVYEEYKEEIEPIITELACGFNMTAANSTPAYPWNTYISFSVKDRLVEIWSEAKIPDLYEVSRVSKPYTLSDRLIDALIAVDPNADYFQKFIIDSAMEKSANERAGKIIDEQIITESGKIIHYFSIGITSIQSFKPTFISNSYNCGNAQTTNDSKSDDSNNTIISFEEKSPEEKFRNVVYEENKEEIEDTDDPFLKYKEKTPEEKFQIAYDGNEEEIKQIINALTDVMKRSSYNTIPCICFEDNIVIIALGDRETGELESRIPFTLSVQLWVALCFAETNIKCFQRYIIDTAVKRAGQTYNEMSEKEGVYAFFPAKTSSSSYQSPSYTNSYTDSNTNTTSNSKTDDLNIPLLIVLLLLFSPAAIIYLIVHYLKK